MKNALYILMLSMLATGCLPSFEVEYRSYFKLIKTGHHELHWYKYSSAWSDSPDYVVNINQGAVDTIFITTNLMDLDISVDDTLKLRFSGQPKLYGDKIKQSIKSRKIKILIDTTGSLIPTSPIPSFATLRRLNYDVIKSN
jgi:hypothetical protein